MELTLTGGSARSPALQWMESLQYLFFLKSDSSLVSKNVDNQRRAAGNICVCGMRIAQLTVVYTDFHV